MKYMPGSGYIAQQGCYSDWLHILLRYPYPDVPIRMEYLPFVQLDRAYQRCRAWPGSHESVIKSLHACNEGTALYPGKLTCELIDSRYITCE